MRICVQEEVSHSPPTSPPLCICLSQLAFFLSYPLIDSAKELQPAQLFYYSGLNQVDAYCRYCLWERVRGTGMVLFCTGSSGFSQCLATFSQSSMEREVKDLYVYSSCVL